MSPGTFDDPGAYERLARAARGLRRGGGHAVQPRLLPLDGARLLPGDRGGPRRRGAASPTRRCRGAGRDREAVRHRPRVGARAEPRRCSRCSTSGRCIASTTTSARRPCRTCSPSGSRTRCSSRSGTATTSTACRSRRRRTSGSARGPDYYDSSGALRDLVQNHMLQLLTLLCMEPPASFSADKLRDEKVKVLAGDQAADRRGGRADGRARAVRARRVGRRRGPRLPRRGRVFRTDRRPRPTRRCGSRSRTGAGPGCPSTCAPASGSPAG